MGAFGSKSLRTTDLNINQFPSYCPFFPSPTFFHSSRDVLCLIYYVYSQILSSIQLKNTVSSDSLQPPQPRPPGFFILLHSSILFLPCRFRFFKASLQCITNGTPPRRRNREMEIPDFSLIKTSYRL